MEFLPWIIVTVAIACAMALFKKFSPAGGPTRDLSADEIAALNERFMLLRGRVIGAMILIGILFLLGTWLALSALNRLLASFHGPSTFVLLPQPTIWWFFPSFGSLSLCWELTLQMGTLFTNRETVDLFSDWTNQSRSFWGASSYSGMDSRKVLRWMTLIVTLPIGVFTVLALNMHASVGPYVIRDCGYAFRPCSDYRLADAQRLTKIQGFGRTDGKLTKRAGLVIDFKDGRRWSSADWGDFKDTVDPTLAAFLTQTTNLPIESATTEKEIPPLSENPSSESK